jgi:ferritin-like metal-binding protein YciE
MQALNSMQDLMLATLRDLHTMEQRQLQALPMIAQQAQTPELRQAIQQHEQETRRHLDRLGEVFRRMGQSPQEEPNPVLDAMVQRGREVIDAGGSAQVKEAALIGEAQKFEHLEMAGYGTAAALCKSMGDDECARMLHDILEEEKRSDARLSEIAERQSNPKAAKNA